MVRSDFSATESDGGKNGGLECWESFFIFCVLSTCVEEKLNHGTLASVRQVGESLIVETSQKSELGLKTLFLATRFLSSNRPRASLNRLLTESALLASGQHVSFLFSSFSLPSANYQVEGQTPLSN